MNDPLFDLTDVCFTYMKVMEQPYFTGSKIFYFDDDNVFWFLVLNLKNGKMNLKTLWQKCFILINKYWEKHVARSQF